MPPSRTGRSRAALTVAFAALLIVTTSLVHLSGAAFTGASTPPGSSFASVNQHYGCALGGTVVNGVQSGTTSIGGVGSPSGPVTLTTTATITAVDTTKSFVLFSVSSSGNGINPGAVNVRAELTDSTTVTFTRATSEASPVQMNLAWSVVEYACGVAVQRGTVTVAATTTNVTISAVGATSRAFVLWAKTNNQNDTGWRGDDTALVELTSTTNVQITTSSAPTSHVFAWQVVEFTNAGAATVQRGTSAAFNDTSTSSTSVALGQAANLTSSFVLVDSLSAGTATSDAGRIVGGSLASPTSLSLSRGNTSIAVSSVAWQVVTLNEGSFVQSGSTTLTSVSQAGTLAAIDPARTSVITSAQMGFGQGASPFSGTVNGVADAQVVLTTTATTLTMARGSAANNATPVVYRIEWGGPASTWSSAYAIRQRLVVTATNTNGTPAGYSVPVTFDHATVVAASLSLASGDDVRIARFDGTSWTALDRVLGDGSSWNSASTTIWFKTSAGVTSSINSVLATDGEYWLYYGNRSAAAPPANADNVYLLADGFESGTLSKWSQITGAGVWSASNARARTGTYSLRFGAVSNSLKLLTAVGVNEAGVSIDAYWYMASSIASDMVGLGGRDTSTSAADVRDHGTGFRFSNGLGWDISSFNGGIGTFAEQADSSGQTNTADGWFKITFQMQPGSNTTTANAVRVLKNGAALNPASGWTSTTPVAASGTAVFTAYNVPVAGSVNVDDVVVRKLVVPEPTVSAGQVTRN